MRLSEKSALGLLPFLLLATASQAAAPAGGSGPIAACMVRAAAELSFNGSMYARSGHDAVEKTFGMSDARGQVPISNQTRFSTASASKMFTAVSIGRLVDAGKVAFDAPIGRYLPGLDPQFATITVGQLLNHTSGLGDYFKPANKTQIDAATTAADLLPLALATPPAFAPGSKRSYSNSGFVVLGAIIEKVSGLTYAEFVRKEILVPLGMANTGFDDTGDAEPMTRMSLQGMLDKPEPSPMRQLHASPAGGISSTPSDIARFLSALEDGKLVTKATRAALFLPRPDPGGGAGVYGYGFNVRAGAPMRVGHGGGTPGANAEVALYPESDAQLIALSNYDPPTATRMVTVLETVLFASDQAAACTAALADPQLHAAMRELR